VAQVCRFPDYAASIKMDRPKALRILVAGSYAMSAGSDGRMVVEKLADTEGLVRIDGRDLDAFQFVHARGADRRLFPVIDGPAAEHWDRLHVIAGKHRGMPFTPKETGGLPAVAEVVGFVLQIFAEAFRAGCRSRSRSRRTGLGSPDGRPGFGGPAARWPAWLHSAGRPAAGVYPGA
jgi:hypothetical protein